jgi:ribosomal protein L29
MKLADMQKKSPAELLKHADKLREKINAKRLSIATSDDRQVREIRALRKELAQSLTIANQASPETKEKSE